MRKYWMLWNRFNLKMRIRMTYINLRIKMKIVYSYFHKYTLISIKRIPMRMIKNIQQESKFLKGKDLEYSKRLLKKVNHQMEMIDHSMRM